MIVPARRPEIAEEALAGAGDVEVETLDLAVQASVAAFAERFLASGRSVDILLAFAGIMATPLKAGRSGLGVAVCDQSLGHFALVNRLWPALAAEDGARVVMLSSVAHRVSGVRPEQGAATGVWAATSPMLEGVGGAYLEDCEVAQVTEDAGDDFRMNSKNRWSHVPNAAPGSTRRHHRTRSPATAMILARLRAASTRVGSVRGVTSGI